MRFQFLSKQNKNRNIQIARWEVGQFVGQQQKKKKHRLETNLMM
jgi:hypothetical protein